MAEQKSQTIHASVVAFEDIGEIQSKTQGKTQGKTQSKIGGVILLGESGTGKSSLAYQLMTNHKAQLVADDRAIIEDDGDRVYARAPDALQGLIELRGFGIMRLPYCASCAVVLAIALTPRPQVPRLAEPAYWHNHIPLLHLCAFDIATAPIIYTAYQAFMADARFSPDSIYEI